MTLLDRFRTQPRQSHPDPAVRLAYVAEIPLDDHEAIAAMARDDEDPRVRRAAAAKLMNSRTLASIAEADRDEGVRNQATAMLRDIALEAFEGIGEAESLEAVDAMKDVRVLGSVAKTTTRDIVALRAMSKIEDPHLLGSITRHAVLESARRAAFEWLRSRDERAELLAVAMNSDYKDTAVLAVEVSTDRDELAQIAARSRNKSAAKRARVLLREADEQQALESDEAAEPLTQGGMAIASDRSSVPTDSASVAAADETPAPQIAFQSGETGFEPRWPPADQPSGSEGSSSDGGEMARARARLTELVAEAEAAQADADLASARRRIGLVRREWKDLAAREQQVDGDLEARLSHAEASIGTRDREVREAEARARRDALARLQSLLGRVEPLVAKTDLTVKAADRAIRDVRAALANLPLLPTRQDNEAVSERLRAVQAALTPRVQELREADDWRRFSNVAIQEQLCAKMEALQAVEDPEAVAREVRHLQEQWRLAADVPRTQADALWRRFKTGHDIVWPRCEAHFAALAASRAENLARKMALCAQVEALADSKNWIQTAEDIKKLQAEWKTVGPVSQGREKAVWERFRSACDRFFTRRHEDLAVRKAAWTDNLQKKEALCVRAEALADSTEWDQAASELKKLQAEWKTIGPVKKSRSEAVWLRFRGACDRFFSRYAQRHDTARAERVAARETICAELEALAADDATEPPAGLLETIRAIRGRWQQELAARGVDPQNARTLDERFAVAFNKAVARWSGVVAGSDLDPEANRKRMEALVRRVEDLANSTLKGSAGGSADDALSPTTRLATMLKDALAANTIGGKAAEDTRLAAAVEEVRQAQAAWSRIGIVADDARRQLSERFQRACRRITERVAPSGPATGKPGFHPDRRGPAIR